MRLHHTSDNVVDLGNVFYVVHETKIFWLIRVAFKRISEEDDVKHSFVAHPKWSIDCNVLMIIRYPTYYHSSH